MLTITELRKFDATQWRSQTLEELPNMISSEAIIWVDAEDPTEAELNQLKSHFKITDLNLERFNDEGQRSKIEENGNQLSCFICFPSSQNFVSETKTEWLQIVADKNNLMGSKASS